MFLETIEDKQYLVTGWELPLIDDERRQERARQKLEDHNDTHNEEIVPEPISYKNKKLIIVPGNGQPSFVVGGHADSTADSPKAKTSKSKKLKTEKMIVNIDGTKKLWVRTGDSSHFEELPDRSKMTASEWAEIKDGTKSTPRDKREPFCPYCFSTHVTAFKKGFGVGKAAVGGLAIGPVGLLAGFVGSNHIELVCLSCGKHFNPS